MISLSLGRGQGERLANLDLLETAGGPLAASGPPAVRLLGESLRRPSSLSLLTKGEGRLNFYHLLYFVILLLLGTRKTKRYVERIRRAKHVETPQH